MPVLRVATVNVNGIRAAHRRGFDVWLADRGCDVVALQEVRCPVAALPEGAFAGYHAAYDPGVLAGRNGVAVLTRQPPAAVRTWAVEVHHIDVSDSREPYAVESAPLARHLWPFRNTGRYIEVDLADAPLTVASLYVPKGGLPAELQQPGRMRGEPDGGARYLRKMRFLNGIRRQLEENRRLARRRDREFLLMGDLNVAHGPLDVHHWRRQVRSEGFLPTERAWLDEVIGPRRLVDVVRQLHPDVQGPYSWWSWLGNSFANDSGWRIDYHLATPRLARTALAADTDREPSRDERRSDHAAVVVDYDVARLGPMP